MNGQTQKRMEPMIQPADGQSRARGFTRIELLAVLSALALLAVVAWPALAGTRPRSERVTCLNNLRQIGQGFRAYASSHDALLPWLIPPPEGIKGNIKAQNAFYSFFYASNELGSPQILVCPSDRNNFRSGGDFFPVPQPGKKWSDFGGYTISYFVGFHAQEIRPDEFLSGDRNLRLANPVQYCGLVSVTANVLAGNSLTQGWTNGLHHFQGNLLRADGRVEQLSSERLRATLRDLEQVPQNLTPSHIILPR